MTSPRPSRSRAVPESGGWTDGRFEKEGIGDWREAPRGSRFLPPKGEGRRDPKDPTIKPSQSSLQIIKLPYHTNTNTMAAKPWSMDTILRRTHPLTIMRQLTHMQTTSLVSVCFCNFNARSTVAVGWLH